MKKFVTLLLLLAMVLSLCACGGKEVTQEQVEELVEAVEEAAPVVEDLLGDAVALFGTGDYAAAFEALNALENKSEVAELLAICHYYGYGTKIDHDAAVQMLEGINSPAAQMILAEAANTGKGAVQNPERAEELYKQFITAAQGISAEDMNAGAVYTALAQCYTKGYGTEVDMKKALEAVEKAVSGSLSAFDKLSIAELLRQIERSNNEKAKGLLAYEVLGESVELSSSQKALIEQMYTEARESIQALADSGNVKAMKLMGDYYLNGFGGVAQDYDKAMELFMMAADEDFADAQAQIAYMYQEGLGVEVSYEKAMEWNNRASQQNNAQAQAQIGYMYHMGMGLTQNLDEAGRWYSRAVDQGDPWATVKLAQTELTNSQAYFESHA